MRLGVLTEGRPAAVDGKDSSVDEPGPGREEEGHGVGDLDGRADSTERVEGGHLSIHLWVCGAIGLEPRRTDRAQGNRVRADPLWAMVHGHRAGGPFDRCLGGRVRERAPHRALCLVG